jgi:hypothetical protein
VRSREGGCSRGKTLRLFSLDVKVLLSLAFTLLLLQSMGGVEEGGVAALPVNDGLLISEWGTLIAWP